MRWSLRIIPHCSKVCTRLLIQPFFSLFLLLFTLWIRLKTSSVKPDIRSDVAKENGAVSCVWDLRFPKRATLCFADSVANPCSSRPLEWLWPRGCALPRFICGGPGLLNGAGTISCVRLVRGSQPHLTTVKIGIRARTSQPTKRKDSRSHQVLGQNWLTEGPPGSSLHQLFRGDWRIRPLRSNGC